MTIEYFIENWQTIDKKDIYFSNYEWEKISCYQKLSEAFIREFKNEVYWIYISSYQKLSEAFIGEFKDKVSWYYISYSQKLSEEFIRELKDKVIWECISDHQKLSGRFIDEFIDYMYYEKSFRNIYKERFYQYINSNIYTINKRELCCLGYQWNSNNKFTRLFNSTLPILFSEVL